METVSYKSTHRANADNGKKSSFIAMFTTLPTLDTPLVHPTYLRLLCMAMRARGVDIDKALQDAGLPDWKQLGVAGDLISQRQVQALVAVATDNYQKPSTGLSVGEAAQISAHGPVGYAVVASRDLRQALQTIERFGGLRHGALRFKLLPRQGQFIFEVHEIVNLMAAREFMLCAVFATMLRLMETVLGYRLGGMAVDLPFKKPAWHTDLSGFCDAAFHFDAHRLAFHLQPQWLSSTCVTADARAHALAVQDCERLSSTANEVSLTQRVTEFLEASNEHYPSMSDVARHFSLSPRTFIRHIKLENTSYQKLLNQTRQRKAVWYLHNTRASVEDIAAHLGYADPTNFSRTFRRWFNTTPSELRARKS